MKKTLLGALVMILVLVPSALMAKGADDAAVSAEISPPGQFPVTPGITLTGGWYQRSGVADPNANPLLKKWEEETGVTMDWVIIDSQDKANIVFAADDYPDWSMSDGLLKSLIAGLMAEGVAIDLLPHLNKGYTPNLDAIFKKYPDSLAYSLNPEGQLQSLSRFLKLESNFLEQNFMINKVWLDKLGLEIPNTTEELKQVLIAFRDKDPNGNGKKDELPFGFMINDGFAQHPKSMYGWWGMPTKNGIGIKDGNAYWVPTTKAYRDYIEYMADLYKNGLIDPESMTFDSKQRSQFDAKVDAPDGNKYGFIIAVRGFTGTPGKDEFISIAPPTPAGYKPEVWVHPGRLAIKNVWFMTDSNEYPEHTMAWVDRLYELEQSVQAAFGMAPEGVKLVGNTWTPQDIDPVRSAQIGITSAFPGLFDKEDYSDGRLVLDKSTQFLYDAYYDVYVDYKAKEQWVRAEFSADEQKEVNTLRTDIQTLWLSKQAQWISGAADLNAEWDQYVKQMESMNVARYVELHDIANKRFADAIGDFR